MALIANDEVTHALEAGALLAHCLQQGWLRRHDGERALDVTLLGRKHLAGLLRSVNAVSPIQALRRHL